MANNLGILQQLDEFEGLSQLVSRFTDAMRARLWEKMDAGYEGWADTGRQDAVIARTREKLLLSIERYKAGEVKQLIDIANLSAILWLHQG